MQWVQLYGLDVAGVRSILAALRAEFPYVYGFVDRAGHNDLLLLATLEPMTSSDLPRWEKLPTAVRQDLERIGNFTTYDLWSLLRFLPEDVDRIVADAPVVNSDDNLYIELRAPWTLYEATANDNWELLARGVVEILRVALLTDPSYQPLRDDLDRLEREAPGQGPTSTSNRPTPADESR